MIDGLDIMLKDILEKFHKHNGEYPERIVIYRDGVSEGQFGHVTQNEIRKILRGFGKVRSGYSPKLTFVVVQKRHHTR